MGKTVIVTSGPTNERIDAVMQITNMSTGALGALIAARLAKDPSVDQVFYVSHKMARKPEPGPKLAYVNVTDTDSLLRALTDIAGDVRVDAVVHAAAVGDYKGRWAARAEDVAREIAERGEANGTLGYDEILSILAMPSCLQDDGTKISSYEPNLMVMLDLTTKVIGHIKRLMPEAALIGFKLLENVTNDELVGVASRLREKNGADWIVANDLALIGNGRHPAWIVGPGGVELVCDTKAGIADAIAGLLAGKDPS